MMNADGFSGTLDSCLRGNDDFSRQLYSLRKSERFHVVKSPALQRDSST